MKKLFLLFCLTFSINVLAQDEPETLAGLDIKYGAFAAGMVDFSNAANELAIMNGAGAALTLNRTFFIGGYFLGKSNNIAFNSLGLGARSLTLSHSGFWLGYIYKTQKLVHFGLDAKVGWGTVRVTKDKFEDNIFIINPQAKLEVNIAKYLKVSLGAGYRFANDFIETNNYGLTNADFNSPNATITVKIGGGF